MLILRAIYYYTIYTEFEKNVRVGENNMKNKQKYNYLYNKNIIKLNTWMDAF